MAYRGIAASGAAYELAEGVIWDDRAALVRWVDINKGRVIAAPLAGGALGEAQATDVGQTAGAVALAEDGGLLIAGARGLVTISPDGAISVGPDILERPKARLNDGSIDPQGRFVVGSLSLAGDTGAETLLRVSADGTVETLRRGIRLSNGVAFAPDGGAIYHVDTLAGTVARHSYGPGAFDLEEPWVTVIGGLSSFPDGLTVSADGHLWLAQWGGSGVLRYSANGELLDEVVLDATRVTCPAFVGPGLDILAITSAHLDDSERSDESGAVFFARPGATGIPATRWPGSTTHPYWSESE